MNMISTGSFLTETGASNKQSELVKKLTAAWEKKNSKTARAGGASLMALSLAACGGEDNTPFSQADVDAAVAAVDITTDNAEAMTSNDADIAAAAKTEALTAADGTIYATVDAAYTAGSNLSNADAVTAALTGADGTVYATVDAAVTAGADSVDITTDNAQAVTDALAGTGFDSVAALNDAYLAATAATPALSSALTTGNDTMNGTAASDTITATSSTYTGGDIIVDASSTDSDSLTITATDDIANTPVVAGIENVTFNLDASTTTTGTASEFDIDVANINNATITAAVTKAATTVTTVNITNIGTGNTIATAHNATLAADANADITVNMTKATSQTLTNVTGTLDDLTINSSAATLFTLSDTTAEENITITAAGAVTIADLSAATTSATLQSLDVDAAGAITLTKSTNDGTVDLNTSSGNVVVTLADVATGNFDLTTASGDITVSSADGSTGTLTASATGDADANVTGADGDVTVTSADSFTAANISATGGIAITEMDAVTSMTLSAGQASTLEDVGGVTALTLSGTSATGVTYTVKTGEDDLNVVDTITFTGTGKTTLVVDGTDLVAAAAATAGGTSAASVIATDNSSAESRIKLQEAAGADLDLSALAVDFVEFGHTENSTDKYKLASGQKIAVGADQTKITLDAAAVAGNTATIVVEDDSAATDTTGHLLKEVVSTNIAELTIQANDTEQELEGTDGTDTTAGTADDVGVTVNVGTANVLKSAGAGGIHFASVTAASFDGSASTGVIDFELVNSAVKTITTGSGNDIFAGDGTAAAYKLDGGDGVDTFVMGDTEDYSALAFTMTNIEKIDASATANFAGTFAASQLTGQTILALGDHATNDVLNISLTTGTGETANLSGIDVALLNVAVAGSAGGDNITGSATGVMTIDGNGGADTIIGGAAADTLIGGDGIDTITTGGGRDTVTIETQATLSALHGSRDTVTDFTAGALGDKLNYDGATVGVTALTGTTAFDGSTATAVAAHSTSGNLAANGVAQLFNITVEDVATLTTDGVAVLDALKTGTASGTITMDTSGDIALFAISDGTNTGIYLGDSDADTALTFNEITLIATLNGVDNADLTTANFI